MPTCTPAAGRQVLRPAIHSWVALSSCSRRKNGITSDTLLNQSLSGHSATSTKIAVYPIKVSTSYGPECQSFVIWLQWILLFLRLVVSIVCLEVRSHISLCSFSAKKQRLWCFFISCPAAPLALWLSPTIIWTQSRVHRWHTVVESGVCVCVKDISLKVSICTREQESGCNLFV